MRRRSIVPLAVVAIVAAGCGAGTTSDGATHGLADAAQHGVTKRVVVCDAAVSYTSLAGLRRTAPSVVVFRATGARTLRKIAGIPFTVSTVSVLKTVAGKHLSSIVKLRQTAAVGVQGCETLVSRGNVYLAYLAPFRLRPGGRAIGGQYVTVGLFVHGGSVVPRESAVAFSSLNAGQPSLPRRISIAQARRS